MLRFAIISAVLVLLSLYHAKKLTVRKSHDPGNCSESNHGEMILVKDRENKDTILVCTEDNGNYAWKTTDNSKPSGEYFDPGFDCLDILNKNTKAKDGYYWVDFHLGRPIKVYCDMSTDGGGYMLFGRMNDTVTWNVPSSNDTVEPFGYPHWSSELGDVSVLDFRIQVASKDDFKSTKAHWAFRFKNKRLLKNLMIVDQGGCPSNFPGIGDVSYVKDLITGEIVSRDFSCSIFGLYSHPVAQIGWTMMNLCLEKQCRNGFAYHLVYQAQFDFSGSFRHVITANSSQPDAEATAFFGCYKGKCCACYGPPGGKDVYCHKECEAVNGGTVTKHASAWFWVRLNPPRKVWEKCMEYKSEDENGDSAWYKLVGERNIPVRGRCGRSEPLINDGVVVIEDGEQFDRIPKIHGLLAFRQDNQSLYIRKNESWKVIAEEEKVSMTINQRLARVTALVENLYFAILICGTDQDDCHDDATCVDSGPGSYICTCDEGFTGDGKTCEAQPRPEPKCKKMDLIMVLDRSSSIIPDDYEHMRNFLLSIGKTLRIGERDENGDVIGQGAIVTFSEEGSLRITLAESREPGKFAEVVRTMPGPLHGGRTKTHRGLDLADKHVVTVDAGLRMNDTNVEKIFMVITDGRQTRESPRRGYKYVGDAMKPFNDRGYLDVFAVGVGLDDEKAINEVKDMVRLPENAILAKNYKQLSEIVESFIKMFCPVPSICGTERDDCDKNLAKCADTGPGLYECTCNDGYVGNGKKCIDTSSCTSLAKKKPLLASGVYFIGSLKIYCHMPSGWTLIARFSNSDGKNWISSASYWYDRISAYGATLEPAYNRDMISEAFWRTPGNEIKITRSDDPTHTALLETTNNCLKGNTFRQYITSFGNFRNGAVWSSDKCLGSCSVKYGGQYQSTTGFEMYSCSSDIQSSNYIGFWCDWSYGDGAVMMIGGGGSSCGRADHGIGLTEADAGSKFAGPEDFIDFGFDTDRSGTYQESEIQKSYALNLWIR